MLDVRCILCPVDFSDAARHALAHAVTVARWYRSRIVALHVGSPVMFNPPIILAALPEAANAIPAGRQQIEAQLREWLAPAVAAGLETDVIVTEGPVAAHILDRARTLPADLIVIGSHGRAGVERLILGSVTETVVREATCPVMTVPPAAAATSQLPFTHLLCPVDFSRSSLAALRFAFSLAQESDARLTLLNVFEGAREPSLREADTPEFRSRWESETERELAALVPDTVRDWCSPDVTVAFGRAPDRILDLALTDRADLIVMGVQGRTAMDLILFGSTTNRVIRQASCPVLTLRSI
jgi:nucleotide-binding universal stress UspA family protein